MAHRSIRLRVLAAVAALAFAVSVGCDKKSDPTSKNFDPSGMYGKDLEKQKSAASGGQHEVLSKAGCFTCHHVGGTPAGKKAPDLAKLSDEKKSKDWLVAFIKDPTSKKVDCKMPKQDKLSDEDLGKIADYLLTLK